VTGHPPPGATGCVFAASVFLGTTDHWFGAHASLRPSRSPNPPGFFPIYLVVKNTIKWCALAAWGAWAAVLWLVPGTWAQGPAGQAPAVPATRQADKVVIITVHKEIDDVMLQSITRRLTLAERGGADAIVFDINTPGGEVGAVIAICDRIKTSSVRNTIAWVNTEAISGGAIMALACREIVMNEASHIGNAMPVMIEQGTRRGRAVPQDELKKKILPVLLGNVLDSVRRHNDAASRYQWDEFLAQAMVVNDLQLWWVRHKETGIFVAVDRREAELLFPGQSLDGPARLVGGQAPSTAATNQGTPVSSPPTGGPIAMPSGSTKLAGIRPDMIAKEMTSSSLTEHRPRVTGADAGKYELIERISDGSSAAFLSAADAAHYNFASNSRPSGTSAVLEPIRNETDLKAFLGAKHISRLDTTWSEGLVVFLTNPIVRGAFFVIFVIALIIELTHPGVTLPGVVAVVCLGLALAPAALIGMAGWWTIVAVLAGLVLIMMEVLVFPGLGAPGIAGAVLLFGGLVGSFIGAGGLFPDTDAQRASRLWGISTLLGGMFTAGVMIYFLAKHLESVPLLNRLVLANSPANDDDTGMLAAMGEDTTAPAKVGDLGVAITPLRPAGKVEIEGRVVDAVAEFGLVEPGAKVRVTSVTEFRVAVEQVREG
jgi:membrane-bound ClpP family serine protease